jgi:predicted transcriptional regulator
MFSDNHHQILQALAADIASPDEDLSYLTPAELFEQTQIEPNLIKHLLDELCQNGFIERQAMNKRPIAINLKGLAAVKSPEYFFNKPMNQQGNNWYGDRIQGDKIGGDKVMGNKVQIGTVHGDAVAGNKIITSQNLAQAAQDIKALLDQITIDYPTEGDYVRAGRAIETIKNNPTLKQRLINAAKESGTTALEKAIEAVIDNPAVSIVIAGVKGFIEAEG